jgi:hypothetical protein
MLAMIVALFVTTDPLAGHSLQSHVYVPEATGD